MSERDVVYLVYGFDPDSLRGVWRDYDAAEAECKANLMRKVEGDDVSLRVEPFGHGMAASWNGRQCWRVLAEAPVGDSAVVMEYIYIIEIEIK